MATVKSQIDGTYGEVVEERLGRLCVDTPDGREWWHKTNVTELASVDDVMAKIERLDGPALQDLLSRLQDVRRSSAADGSEAQPEGGSGR